MKKNDLSFPVRGALSLPRMVEGVMGCDTKELTLLGPTTACIGGHTHFHDPTAWLLGDVVVVPVFLLLVQTFKSQHCPARGSYLFDHNIHKDTAYDLG